MSSCDRRPALSQSASFVWGMRFLSNAQFVAAVSDGQALFRARNEAPHQVVPCAYCDDDILMGVSGTAPFPQWAAEAGAVRGGIDHIFGREIPFQNSPANLVPCCDHCNKVKGTQDFNLWLEKCQRASLEEELKAWSTTVQWRIEVLRAWWAKEEKTTARRVNKWNRLIAA
jgi:hypothetical protein